MGLAHAAFHGVEARHQEPLLLSFKIDPARGLRRIFFHAATAYDILRSNGVPVGKRDYMGTY